MPATRAVRIGVHEHISRSRFISDVGRNEAECTAGFFDQLPVWSAQIRASIEVRCNYIEQVSMLFINSRIHRERSIRLRENFMLIFQKWWRQVSQPALYLGGSVPLSVGACYVSIFDIRRPRDMHTNNTNTMQQPRGCVSEFIRTRISTILKGRNPIFSSADTFFFFFFCNRKCGICGAHVKEGNHYMDEEHVFDKVKRASEESRQQAQHETGATHTDNIIITLFLGRCVMIS